jgi:hypothetical protein
MSRSNRTHTPNMNYSMCLSADQLESLSRSGHRRMSCSQLLCYYVTTAGNIASSACSTKAVKQVGPSHTYSAPRMESSRVKLQRSQACFIQWWVTRYSGAGEPRDRQAGQARQVITAVFFNINADIKNGTDKSDGFTALNEWPLPEAAEGP